MLEGRDLILRLLRDADIAQYYELTTAIALRGEYTSLHVRPESALRKRIAENGWWEEHEGLMLITAPDGRFLGDIGFFRAAPYSPGSELGFRLFKPEDRGRGLMTRAVRIFSAYLFATRPVPRLQIAAVVDNLPSRRVAEKCGYQFEGIMRHTYFLAGRHVDCALYSLLRDECPSLKEALRS